MDTQTDRWTDNVKTVYPTTNKVCGGYKYEFLCINICWAPREVLKPEPERRGFQYLLRGPADVNLSEKHVWSLLLHKNILKLNTSEKMCQKVSFFLYL